MDLQEFIDLAKQEKWATDWEIKNFVEDWTEGYVSGDEGFGEESTLEDWQDGLAAWRKLVCLGRSL